MPDRLLRISESIPQADPQADESMCRPRQPTHHKEHYGSAYAQGQPKKGNDYNNLTISIRTSKIPSFAQKTSAQQGYEQIQRRRNPRSFPSSKPMKAALCY